MLIENDDVKPLLPLIGRKDVTADEIIKGCYEIFDQFDYQEKIVQPYPDSKELYAQHAWGEIEMIFHHSKYTDGGLWRCTAHDDPRQCRCGVDTTATEIALLVISSADADGLRLYEVFVDAAETKIEIQKILDFGFTLDLVSYNTMASNRRLLNKEAA